MSVSITATKESYENDWLRLEDKDKMDFLIRDVWQAGFVRPEVGEVQFSHRHFSLLENRFAYFAYQIEETPEGSLKAERFRKYLSKSIELPVPSDLAILFTDLINQKAESVLSMFNSIHGSLAEITRLDGLQGEILKKLDDLQLLFGLAKRPYNENTLNYEINSEIQTCIIKLISLLEDGDLVEARKMAGKVLEVLQTLVKAKTQLKEAGAEMVTIEDTGEKIGEMRIFRKK